MLLIDNDPQGNLTAALGYTPGEQKRTLANLLLAEIDYPEDMELHLQRPVLHTDSGIDLIAANRRLADAAARLQVMQLSHTCFRHLTPFARYPLSPADVHLDTRLHLPPRISTVCIRTA